MAQIDRSAVARALAKAIAYKQCGKHAEAELWGARLLGLLAMADILDPARVGLHAAADDARERGLNGWPV
jgi:hypothetical protein